jgi:hypothetical protein
MSALTQKTSSSLKNETPCKVITAQAAASIVPGILLSEMHRLISKTTELPEDDD